MTLELLPLRPRVTVLPLSADPVTLGAISVPRLCPYSSWCGCFLTESVEELLFLPARVLPSLKADSSLLVALPL